MEIFLISIHWREIFHLVLEDALDLVNWIESLGPSEAAGHIAGCKKKK